MTKKTETDELTIIPVVDQAVVPDDDGFYHDAEWIKVTCEGWAGLEPRPGFSPLWAELDASLTIREASLIPNPFEATVAELVPHVAPRVRAWNVKWRNPETGQVEPVPPPAEIGGDAFLMAKTTILAWLAFTLKTLHLGGGPNRGKETSASDDGSSGSGDAS